MVRDRRARVATLIKQRAALAPPPARTDATKWQTTATALQQTAADLTCTKSAAAAEPVVAGFAELRDPFWSLVLLLPAS